MIVVHARWRRCSHCGAFKPQTRKNFSQRRRGKRMQWDPWCLTCRAATSRARYRRIRADPQAWREHLAYHDAYRRRRRAENPAYRAREIERSRRWREKQSPAAQERIREDGRIRAKLWRERQGLPIREATRKQWVGIGRTVLLDPAPVIAFVRRCGGPAPAAKGNAAVERALRRVLNGESRQVELGVVDALTVAHRLFLADLYDPAEHPEAYE
jgi:hypothetical protein